MVRRETKREKLTKLKQAKRKALRLRLNDGTLNLTEKFAVLAEIEKLPKDSCATRLTHRCQRTGRSRGVYSKFKLARNELRRLAMQGEVPGLVKSSW
jgi:small subunit ribosomal protein S14